MPLLRESPDLVAEIDARRGQLDELVAPLDAVVLLGQLVLAEMPTRADEYVESEHSGAAHVIELTAAALARRQSRHGTTPGVAAIDAKTLTPLKDLIWEMVLLEGLRRYRNAGALQDDAAVVGARGRAAIAHLMLRGPGWPWQEQVLLRDLFEPYGETLKASLGFDADEAVACSHAAAELINSQLTEHMKNAHLRAAEAIAWANTTLGGWQSQPSSPTRDRAIAAIWALMHVGAAMVLRPRTIADQASVVPASADAYLRALSTPFGQDGGPFEVAEVVRLAPYLVVGTDEYFLAVPGEDLWALRTTLEQALPTEGFAKHRGKWLERRATDLLARTLAPDETHTSVKIIGPDGRSVLGEIDGLLRFGDAVLLIEAKAATMRPGARRGGMALVKHLKTTVTKASEQAQLAHDVLHGIRPGSLRLSNGSELSLEQAPREIHPILVTLDDLSAIGPTVWEIVGSALLPKGRKVPWIVTLHELDLVCQTVESPIQMIHFLGARSRLNQLGGRVASDELDWWMLYLRTSLYFEDAPAERLRVFSQTDDLDAWVLYEHGDRRRRASKPRQVVDAKTTRTLQVLADERPPGWVAAGCTLLSISDESRKRLGRDMASARKRAQERGLVQRGTLGFSSAPDPVLICWVVAPNSSAKVVIDALKEYVSERLDEQGVQRVLGIAVTASSMRPYDALVVIEHAVWTLPVDANPRPTPL